MSLLSKKLGLVLFGFEILFIILFGVFMDYDESANAHYESNSRDLGKGANGTGADHDRNQVKDMYPSKSFSFQFLVFNTQILVL